MRKILTVVLLITGTSVMAQSVLSSHYPVGLPIGHVTGPSTALGGSGVGVQNDFYGMADNPGNLGALKRATFSSFLSIDYLGINQNSSNTGSFSLSPQLISFAFPLDLVGTFGFSLDRRTNMNYKWRGKTTTVYPGGSDVFDLGVAKSGGLTSWQAGWGKTFAGFVQAGITYERIYLSGSEIIQKSLSSKVPGSAAPVLSDSTYTTFRGNGFRLGVLIPYKKVTFGVSGEYILSGDLESYSKGDQAGNGAAVTSTLQLPPSLTAGASWQISPQWLTATSVSATLWQEYSSGYLPGKIPENAMSFSVGGQFIPAPNLLVPRYWEIMQYRAGLRYSQLPVSTASEMAITLSLGLPVQIGGGLFDIIGEFGRRSDSAIPDYSENFIKIGIGLNGGSKWFQSSGTRY